MEIDKKILEQLGVLSLRESQEKVIYSLLNGDKDLLAVMPTGSGKTLCFQYFASVSDNIVIILYPLLSLMTDQQKRFLKAKIPSVVLKGGQTKEQRREIFEKIRLKKIKAIIANPEVLINKKVLGQLAKFGKYDIVFDECHTIVEWGESFRDKMLQLKCVFDYLCVGKIAAFTATLSSQVEDGLKKYIFINRSYEKIYYSANRENIEYRYVQTPVGEQALYEILQKAQMPCIVFANDRKLCERTSEFINKFLPKLKSKYYHAGLSKTQRAKIEEWFYKTDSGVLAATCAFGMGVDKSNVRSVVHLKLPENVSAFLQESGRAGRDGARAVSYSIITDSELKRKLSPQRALLISCFTGQNCIRHSLLLALGERGVGRIVCSGCSKCYSLPYRDKYYHLISRIAKKYSKIFSPDVIALLLCGVKINNIPFCSHLSFFGILKDKMHPVLLSYYLSCAIREKIWR